MNTTYAVIVGIIMVIMAAAIGSYAYLNRDTVPQTGNNNERGTKDRVANDAPTEKTSLIEMNETSFSPNAITISIDTKVIFKNIGNRPIWPASNIHPTHGIYPEFDPQRPIPPGESWSFVFTKAGIWRMHDHLAPSILGTITVTE